MKTRLPSVLLALIVTLSMSCEDKLLKPFELLGDKIVDKELNLYLKFDCLEKVDDQPVHLDLKHGLGIISKIDATSTNINSMHFYIMEVEGKDRYDLENAKYENTTKDDKGVQTHHFRVTINTGSKENKPVEVSLSALNKMMTKGDIIDIHIDSNDPNLQSKPHTEKAMVTKFGNQFCKSIVINP
ncbi:hypothetical protein [Psychroserpens sp.]|uniref:hypothetical protein n=1 Tax=Psychroserpens sp. TaxID=2020870 RepID=UPI002B271E03|nr:hypothetical protein [Psychroserpens sp.]